MNRGLRPLKQQFISFFIFNIRFNWALINRSGAMVRQRNFQSVIASLNRGIKKNLYLIGLQSVVQVL